ncbi:LysR family transcriptional regulator [Alcaligenaceae bacterium]|nr:LysR family transcriptional regulator [Alcaligenaceae bacterium]
MTTDWTDRIRLRNLRILLSLATTKNLSQSAGLLNATQPGLSKWLKELEEDIGLQLFERHARGLKPTYPGEALIAHAKRICAQLDRAVKDMKSLRDSGTGRIVIGASGAAASEAAPRAILLIAETIPDLQISMMEGTMDVLLDLLRQGDLDIVIGRTTSEHISEEGIRTEVLYTEPVNFVARYDHPLFLSTKTIDWSDLQRYPWIVWPSGTPIRNALDEALVASSRTLPPKFIESNSVSANITLINNSDMIGTASHRATLMLARMELLRILPVDLQGLGSVSMYWRNDELFIRALQQSLECLRNVAAAQLE